MSFSPTEVEPLRRAFWLKVMLVVLCALFVVGPVRADDEKLTLNFFGMPLEYQRVLEYEKLYPDVSGFYVRSLHGPSPAVRAGLRVDQIITEVDGRSVSTLKEIREIARKTRGETITFRVRKLDPAYRKRKRDNPFYEPRHGDPYNADTFQVFYPLPETVTRPVVTGSTGKLYHKLNLNHSPDTGTNTVHQNPDRAGEAGLSPCPVCFPSGDEDEIQNMIQEKVLGGGQFLQSLTAADELRSTPSEAVELIDRLEKFRLRETFTPSVRVYESGKMYAFGLPSGQLVFTENLFTFAEKEPERAVLLAHLLAHADRRHDYSPVEERRFRSLIERAISRTAGVDFEFQQIKDWSPAIPGFSYYHEILEQGYGDANEREAIFLSMVFAYRAGYDVGAVRNWLDAQEDMLADVHPSWIDYLLTHPLPANLYYDLREWEKRVPKVFDRSDTS